MINWKVIAVFAIFAFIVSFFTGIFSGVAFLELFLRALLWGILFGGLGLGVLVAANRFLPELADIFGTNKITEKSENGEEVDIVLPDENPHKSRIDDDFMGEMDTTDSTDTMDESNNESDAAEDEFKTEEFNNGKSDDEKIDNKHTDEEMSDEAFYDESEEVPVKKTKGKNKQKGKSRAEDMETLEEIGDNSFSEINELDNLPDLDKFSGSFSSFDDIDASTPEGTVFKSKESVDISGVKQDPSKVAKAIHTWIERDKEG